MEDHDMETNKKNKFNLNIYQNQKDPIIFHKIININFIYLMIIIKVDSNIDA